MSSHPYRLSGPLNPTQGKHYPDTPYSILHTLIAFPLVNEASGPQGL